MSHEHGDPSHDHRDAIGRLEAVETVFSLRSRALAAQSTERISISGAFEGRVLSESLLAESDMPAHSHSTMDGFAFDANESYPFDVRDGEVFPEDDPQSLAPNESVRVATGAPIPEDANAVLKIEEATVRDGELHGPPIDSGTYVYERGSNVTAGETLFESGDRLSAKDAIVLRDLGYDSVPVVERLDVGLLATGTEIHEGRSSDLDSAMLASLVRTWGHEAAYEGTVPDEYDRVEDAIASIAAERDVVVTTGGTSVGKKDHVIRALRSLGDVRFHRVRVRPGKPIAAAVLPDHDAVAFAVPGKPVGAHTIATLVMRPFFTGESALAEVSATATVDVDVPTEGFEYAIPVTISDSSAEPLGHESSPLAVYGDTFDPSVLSSSTRATLADGFVLTESGFEAEETVSVVPYATTE
ncbi:molybdopterin molybdotransferase MoeA [Halorussus salinisoli]|uniref:molybdopterin molybdotransferase MoeA n=1 Tax=Halorussus salinisoli TaxID=2558242 RepID=UPI0010C1ADB7|nr:molybdopterin molybdotransferase MoeA [Halorussus salinisoli]